MNLKTLFVTIILFQGITSIWGQTTHKKEVEEQIKQVENNLAGRLKITGESNILDRMAHFKVKGLSIAVVKNHEVVWAKGYGWADVNEKRPVTTETLFKPGSISKSLNAVGALRLVQDHQLDLYKDINEYLSSWKFPYDSLSKRKKISLANLLSHTAGLSVYGGFPGYDPKAEIPTVPEILDGKAPANTPAVRSLFEPGLRFQYSGGGTIISQLMITDVTGQRYETFMRDSVLKPLGMVHSYFSAAPPAGDQLKKIARGYTKEGAEVKATFHVYPEQAPLGLWTTPSDLCRYMIELQKAYQGSSSKVLNREMAGLHLTPYIDKSVAMGVFTDERKGVKYFFHDAANEGYRGLYYGTVEGGDGVAICVNSDDGTIILELLNSVASVYNWGGFDKPLSIDPVKLPEAIAQKYPGIYIYDGDIAEITKEADGLYFWTAGQNCKMYFTSEKDFVNVEFTAEKSFITNASGTVTGYARKVKETVYPPAIKVNNLDTVKVNEGQMSLFGWHLLESKRYNKAMSCFTRVLELKPDDVTAKRNLGHCYLFTGEYDKAIKLYKECLVQLPGGPSPKEALNMEFGFFEKSGFDKTVMQKAGKELGL